MKHTFFIVTIIIFFLAATPSFAAEGDLSWAKSLGNAGDDCGFDISSLSDGSSIVTGSFTGIVTFGNSTEGGNQTDLTSDGLLDIFIAKYNPDGTLNWAKKAGGLGIDQGLGITTLSDGTSIITGYFGGPDGDNATFGFGEGNESELISAGDQEFFLAKFNPDGTLNWVKRAGGIARDYGYSVSALPGGSVYVTGIFASGIATSATFGAGEGNETVYTTTQSSPNMFVAKYNPDGTLNWVNRTSGGGGEYGRAISAFSDGSTAVTGSYWSTSTFGNSSEGGNQVSLTPVGNDDFFVAKYNPDGTLDWAKSAGSLDGDEGLDIIAFSDGSVAVVGYFADYAGGTVTFGDSIEGGNQTDLTAFDADGDAFIAKYNSDGTLNWAERTGTNDNDYGYGISALSDGTMYLTGSWGTGAVFVEKRYPNGSLAWTKAGWPSTRDYGHAVAAFADNSAVVTGRLDGNMTLGVGETNQITFISAGMDDFFIARFMKNTPPSVPTLLTQKDLNDSSVPNQDTATTPGIKLSAITGDDPDDENVQLQIELRPFSEPYTGVPTHSAGLATELTSQTITVSLPNENYIWRARTRDAGGAFSGWVEFNATTPNFTIDSTGLSRTQERFQWYDADDAALAAENTMATVTSGTQVHLRLQARTTGGTWYVSDQCTALEYAQSLDFSANKAEVSSGYWDDTDHSAGNVISSAFLTGTNVSQTYVENTLNYPDNQSNLTNGECAEWDFTITAPSANGYYYYRFKVSDVIDSVSPGGTAVLKVEDGLPAPGSVDYWVNLSSLTGQPNIDSTEVIGAADGVQGSVAPYKWSVPNQWKQKFYDPVGMTDVLNPISNVSVTAFLMVGAGLVDDTYNFQFSGDAGVTWADIYVTTTEVDYSPYVIWTDGSIPALQDIRSWDNVTNFETHVIITARSSGGDTVTWDIDAIKLTVEYEIFRTVVMLPGQTTNFGGSPVITGTANDIVESAGSYNVSVFLIDKDNVSLTGVSTGTVEIWTPGNQSIGIVKPWVNGAATFTVENIDVYFDNYVLPVSDYPDFASDKFDIIPPVLPPAGLTRNSVSTTSIEWSWTDTNTSPNEEGHQLLDNSSDLVVVDSIAVDSTFTVETGLSANTLCTRKVRAYTDGQTTFSDNSNIVSVFTLINQASGFIYTDCSSNSISMQCDVPPSAYDCQTAVRFDCVLSSPETMIYTDDFENGFGNWINVIGDDADWSLDSDGTSSSGTGPDTGNGSSIWYVYTEATGKENFNFYLQLDCAGFDLATGSVEFAYHMCGTDMGTLRLEVWTGATWECAWSLSGNQGAPWYSTVVKIGDFSGYDRKLRFRGTTGSSFRSDMALDDISVYTSLSGLGADNSGWLTTNTYTDVGLVPNATYEYRVIWRNGDGIASAPSGTLSTVTAAAVPVMTNTAATFTAATENTITIQVGDNGNPGGTVIELFYADNPAGTWTSNGSLTSGYQWIVSGLAGDTSYWFKARAQNLAGYQTDNCAVTVWSTIGGAPPPENIYVSNSGDNANDGLTWGTAVKTIQRALDLGA
ncbi:MAG: hypothetical protein ACYS8W_07900, partial [Planctomycetota bacterium]